MRRARLAFLPALLALTLAACGDDGEEQQSGTTQGGQPPATQPPATQPPASGQTAPGGEQPGGSPNTDEEDEIRAAVSEYLGGLAADNAPQVCDALTDQAQELLGRDLGVEADKCEEAAREVATFATGQAQQALRDANAVDIQVMGNRATAEVSLAGNTVPIELEKQPDGEWSVADANEEALREALP